MFTVSKTSYKTKKEALDFFRNHINGFSFNQEFESEDLSNLILEHHYYCKQNNLKPIKFKKIKYGDSYFFNAYFEGYGWKQTSWRTCIEGHSLDKQIKNAARDLVKPLMDQYRTTQSRCEHCGSTEKLEVDHKSKDFSDIINELISKLSVEERDKIQKENNWLLVEDFSIQETSEFGGKVLDSHIDMKYQVLCKPCHINVTRNRLKEKV